MCHHISIPFRILYIFWETYTKRPRILWSKSRFALLLYFFIMKFFGCFVSYPCVWIFTIIARPIITQHKALILYRQRRDETTTQYYVAYMYIRTVEAWRSMGSGSVEWFFKLKLLLEVGCIYGNDASSPNSRRQQE